MLKRTWMRVVAGVVGLAANAAVAQAQDWPFGGSAWQLPGTVQAEDFDEGGEGAAYYDTTGGNAGWQYRDTNVDIEYNSVGGYDVGWTAAGEFLNYTVDVASAGEYVVQLRVASLRGGYIHVGFNGPSGVWTPVGVDATGGWQEWTTVSVPVTLGAGRQVLTLVMDSGGVNLDEIAVAATGSYAPAAVAQVASTSAGSSGGSFRMMTWNIQHGTTAYGGYDLTSQAQFIASQSPDVVA